MTDEPGGARSLAADQRHACSGIEFPGTNRGDTTEKVCDRWRYGGETNGKGRPPIRGSAQDLRIERSRVFSPFKPVSCILRLLKGMTGSSARISLPLMDSFTKLPSNTL